MNTKLEAKTRVMIGYKDGDSGVYFVQEDCKRFMNGLTAGFLHAGYLNFEDVDGTHYWVNRDAVAVIQASPL